MNSFVTLFYKRLAIILFWFTIIGCFLFLPALYRHLNKRATLTIFTPPLLLDPVYIKKFEEKTGVKVVLAYFENGAALLSKLAAVDGKGYDLILPDDHTLALLINQNALKEIDKTKLTFWNDIHPSLLNVYFDPDNTYTVPYYWGVYGIGYDAQIFPNGLQQNSWAVLFDKALCPNAKICMTDEPREALLIAARYLFGSIDELKKLEAQEAVKQLLIKQKKQVEVYSLSRADTLLQTNSCALATIASPEAWRVSRNTPNIKMAIPKEGSFLLMDSFAIPRNTGNDLLIYEFLNFIFEQESIRHHSYQYGFCSPLHTVNLPDQQLFCPINEIGSFDFFREVISDKRINELWIEVLAA